SPKLSNWWFFARYVEMETQARASYTPEALETILTGRAPLEGMNRPLLPEGWLLGSQSVMSLERSLTQARLSNITPNSIFDANELQALQQLVGENNAPVLMRDGPLAQIEIINAALAGLAPVESDLLSDAQQLFDQVTTVEDRDAIRDSIRALAPALAGVTLAGETRTAEQILTDTTLEKADIAIVLQYLQDHPDLMRGQTRATLDNQEGLSLGDLRVAITRIREQSSPENNIQ
ncbi:MAG: hypothetical protein ACOYJ2_04140, partial [Rickettsiales bacterium]